MLHSLRLLPAFGLALLLVGMSLSSALAQERYVEKLWSAEVYPEEYAFDDGAAFEANNEFRKAFWYYLNLFEVDPDSAILSSRRIATQYEEPEPEMRNAFAIYAQDDPELAGAAGENARKQKARWLDEITACLDDIFFKSRRPYHLNNSGLQRYERGDMNGALMAFSLAVELDPKAKYQYNLGYVRHQVGQYQHAIGNFNASIDNGHRLAEAHYYRGFCKGKLGDKGDALKDFSTSIQIDPNYVDPLLTRGFERFKVGAFDLALSDLDKVLTLDPFNPDAYLSRGFIHHRLGNADKACSDWINAEELGVARVSGVLQKYCSSN